MSLLLREVVFITKSGNPAEEAVFVFDAMYSIARPFTSHESASDSRQP